MADQLLLLDTYPQAIVQLYLAALLALEAEEDRLRQEKADLRAAYAAQLPLRALHTAVKRVRAMRKLEAHPKDPLPRTEQAHVEACVEEVLDALEREQTAVHQEAEGGVRGGNGHRMGC